MDGAWVETKERQDYVPQNNRVNHKVRPHTAQHYGLSHILGNNRPPAIKTRRPVSAVAYGGTALIPTRPDNSAVAAGRVSRGTRLEPERLLDDNMKQRVQLSHLKQLQRTTTTENRRLEAELVKANINLRKAEELLNLREKALSPTIGLSQMYRTSDTTHLVTALKERVRHLTGEKDKFRDELEDALKSVKATKVAELQSELHAMGSELDRQRRINAEMQKRMVGAEVAAQAATEQAGNALCLAQHYANIGDTMPTCPARLAPGNTLCGKRVRKTMAVLQQAHRVILSQAQLVRAVFPPGMSMEEFAQQAALKQHTLGGTEILHYMRSHINKINSELSGQPGGPMDPDMAAVSEAAAAAALVAATAIRGRTSSSSGIANTRGSPMHNRASKPVNSSSVRMPPPDLANDNGALLQAIADLVRMLRSMDMDGFLGQPDFEAEVEQLSDVMTLFVAEHNRLKGVAAAPVFDDDEEDVQSQRNPLYTPVPSADPALVPAEQTADTDEEAAEYGEEEFEEEDNNGNSEVASSCGGKAPSTHASPLISVQSSVSHSCATTAASPPPAYSGYAPADPPSSSRYSVGYACVSDPPVAAPYERTTTPTPSESVAPSSPHKQPLVDSSAFIGHAEEEFDFGNVGGFDGEDDLEETAGLFAAAHESDGPEPESEPAEESVAEQFAQSEQGDDAPAALDAACVEQSVASASDHLASASATDKPCAEPAVSSSGYSAHSKALQLQEEESQPDETFAAHEEEQEVADDDEATEAPECCFNEMLPDIEAGTESEEEEVDEAALEDLDDLDDVPELYGGDSDEGMGELNASVAEDADKQF